MQQKHDFSRTATLSFLFMLFGTTIFSIPLLSDTYILAKVPILALALTLLIGFLSRVKSAKLLHSEKLILACSLIFLASMLIAGYLSGTSTTRLLWGEATRGNGLINYFLLVSVFLLTSKYFYLVKVSQFARAAKAFLYLSTLYFFLQEAGLNIFSEKYTYGSMVGFFGNPNFTSSFLGMSFTVIIGVIVFQNYGKIPLFILAIGIILAIYLSGSIQGLFLVFFALVFYAHIWAFQKGINRTRILISSLCTFLISTLTFMGFLGLGPLGEFLERQSLRIRFGYFETALLIFRSNPLTGVGTDSYGDHFRQYRPEWLITIIGDATTSNDAHNVYLNILATSGLLTFLFFTALNVFVIFRGFVAILNGSRDLVLIVSFVGLLSFQIQSLISINQIGLSIWGWFAMGVVISRTRPQISKEEELKVGRTASYVIAITLILGLISSVAFLGSQRLYESLKLKAAIGTIIVDADLKYREAKFIEIANLSDYWIKDVTNSILIQEAFLNLGASEAAESISEATYFSNQNSRDALWALTAIKTRREKIEEAIILREKLILKENMSSWVLLDQAEAYINVSNSPKAKLYLDLARTKQDVDQVRLADLEQKLLSIE